MWNPYHGEPYISWQRSPGLTFGQLFPGPRMIPRRAVGYLFKHMANYCQAIDCGYVEHKTKKLAKTSKTYPKPADTKIAQKEL